MKKLMLLGLGIAGMCVAGLNGRADAASCSKPAQATNPLSCTETTDGYTGRSTIVNNTSGQPRILRIELLNGNGRNARASTIGFNSSGTNIGSDQILTPTLSHQVTLSQNIATHDVFALGS